MSIEQEIHQNKFATPHNKFALNLMNSSRRLESFLKTHFKQEGLSMQQYNILRILRGSSPTPLSTLDIRERMIDKMSDTSRIVDRLIIKKLVTKKISAKDNRLVEVRITNKGLALLEKLKDTDEKIVSFLSSITTEEAKTLSNLLDKIVEIQ
ncbi:MAG TPA: MarR family transcriptional regulator [Niabella sp.]|nr:MarR family transcriptional regulator [Niabella sp.]HOZ95904.1 MarR family transcriptional regulator [Niabella sp.]HQW15816.1 MarR family transcriptional regulator [Niabella sp.]HQX20956.1 MarR family transcriptional regulator [Niabella sp.]HQX41254.1 MarR family transcriptional regulator [Niabella sp.]